MDIDQKLTKLDFSNKDHPDPLILNKYINLEELNCSNSNLTYLDVSGCTKLAYINASHNRISKIFVNNEGLKYLNLLDNNFPEQDLTMFSELVNLKELHIGNVDNDKEGDVYNRFHGSLEPLKDLNNLENLSINNTDVDSGLEHLPTSVKILRCLADKPNVKVKSLNMQLENFVFDVKDVIQGKYNLKAWRKNWNLENDKENLQNQINSHQRQMEELASNEKEYLKFQQVELEKEEKDLRARQEEIKLEKSRLEQEVKILRQQVESLKTDLVRINAIYQSNEKKIYEMESKLATFTADQYTDKARLQDEINALIDDLTVKDKEKMSLESEIKRTNQKLEDKKDEIEELEGKLNEVSKSISNLKNKKDELNQLKEDFNNKLYGSKVSTANLRKQMENLKTDIRSKSKELSNQLEEQKKIKDKLVEARRNAETIQEEKDQMENDLESYCKKEKNFQDNLANLTTKLEDKEVLINKLQEEKRQQVNELKGRLGEIKDLYPQIETKELELKELIDTVRTELSKKRKPMLEKLLEEQKKSIEINEINGNSDSEELKYYSEQISSELDDIQILLSKQKEVIQLKIQLRQKFEAHASQVNPS
ncbi:8712_t:CDS:1 [Funneliformis geosporum]|uniref:8712_t:CDS:1 n=1 Tax=Funneliformis geosporum TaxID=1117311 RepID=A0A9W4WRE9_9GLOM|nr:8712_t:CDS:1 [Funneliformis geosporum]